MGRLMLGLGVGVAYFNSADDLATRTAPGPFQPSSTTTRLTRSAVSLTLAPGLRYSLLRTSDHLVELFGQLDFGFARAMGSPSSSTTDELGNPAMDPANSTTVTPHNPWSINGDVGLGVRFWAHPHFAVGAVTLVNFSYGVSGSRPAL